MEGGYVRYAVSIEAGRKTSLSIEPLFLAYLRENAKAQGSKIAPIIRAIDEARVAAGPQQNLSSAVRCTLLDWAMHGDLNPARALTATNEEEASND